MAELMIKLIRLFTFSLYFAAFLSCSRHECRRLLDAERLMESHPDSALSILESISSSSLKSEQDQALYGLLLTQALDKNHRSLSNDSLISRSVNYYKLRGDALKQILSNYYQGRVRYHSDNMHLAIVSFIKAKEIAESNGYDFWAGMACRGISDIYNGTYNAAEELKFAEEEHDFIQQSGKQPYINYSIYDLGRAMRNNGKWTESLAISQQLQDSAIKYHDSFLYNCALQLKAYNLMDMNKFDDSYELLYEICSGDFAETADTLYLCNVLFELGRTNEAERLLGITSEGNLPLKSQVRYRLAKSSHRYLDALKEAEFIDSIVNTGFRTAMNHNLTSSITEYYGLTKKLDEIKLRESRIAIWLITLVSLFAILVVGGLGWCVYKRQNKRISEKVLLADQLQEDLNNSRRDNTSASAIIKSLMSTKYEMLEELSSILLVNNDTKVARRKIADAVTRIIDDFSIRSEKIVALENKVDLHHNNLMSDLKNDLPNLKEIDYRLYLFSVLGLSNATISLFLKEDKIEAIYNRKRRLKDKIKQLGEPKSARYLSYFR